MFCRKCGSQIDEGQKFCIKCGTPVEVETNDYHVPEQPDSYALNESSQDNQHEDDRLSSNSFASTNKEPLKSKTDRNKKKKWIPFAAVVVGIIIVFVIAMVIYAGNRKKTNYAASTAVNEQAQLDDKDVTNSRAPEGDNSTNQVQPATETGQIETEQQIVEPYCQQRVIVSKNSDGYNLYLERWIETDIWEQVFSCKATISEYGTTLNKREGDGQTPAGTFDLLFCIGIIKPDTKMDYIGITSGDVWVDDSNSRYYNTLQKSNSGGKDWNSAENIYSYFQSGKYNVALFFNYNGDGLNSGSSTAGNGSVIFLLGRNASFEGNTNSGDIYISAQDMTQLLSFLDSSKHPTISIE